MIGFSGSSGDNGNATSATLNYPAGLSVDSTNNLLYIADTSNKKIRLLTLSSGIITTCAGTGDVGSSGDGGAATYAQLAYPQSVSNDMSGNVYIADSNNNKIRKVNSAGTISTYAGTGTSGSSGDGYAATSATINYPIGVAADMYGNLYIAGSGMIRMVNRASIITTIAGDGTYSWALNVDGSLAVNAHFSYLSAVAVDVSGNVYIADAMQYVIYSVANGTGEINFFAGVGSFSGSAGDGGPATSAYLNYPKALAVDSDGSVYIGDGPKIRQVYEVSRSHQPTSQPTEQPTKQLSRQPSSAPTVMASPTTYYVIPNMYCGDNNIGNSTILNSRQSCNSLCDRSNGCMGTMWSEGPTCGSLCGTCWLKTALSNCFTDTGFTTTVQMIDSDSNYHVISNFDCWQNDLPSPGATTVSSCKAACTANSLCVGFVYQPSTGYCWLKAALYNNLNCGFGDGKYLYVSTNYETIQGSENVMITTNFIFSGNYQTYAVPPVVKSLFVTAAGASAVDPYGSTGTSYGGFIQAVIPVASINTLYLYLGGQNTGGGSNVVGGFNGGGTNQGGGGGGGGGATDIRTVIDDCTSRLLVAGGAGGSSGYGAGGAGGGLIGQTGGNGHGGNGGGGGSQTSGGADIPDHNTGANTAGSFCHGGNGWYASGGGGYYGGAGDGSNGGGDTLAGGGGGSSYCTPTGTILANDQGAHDGDGYLMIHQCVTEYKFQDNTCVYVGSSSMHGSWTSVNYNFENIVSTSTYQYYAEGVMIGGWTTGGNYDLGLPAGSSGGGGVAIISAQWTEGEFSSPYPNNLQYGCWLQTVNATSFITRTLMGVTVGHVYFVSFWTTCRNFGGSCPPANTFSVQLDGTIVYSTSPSSSSSWVQVSTALKVATSTSMMLMFRQSTSDYPDYGIGINAISVELGTPTGQPTEQPSSQPSVLPWTSINYNFENIVSTTTYYSYVKGVMMGGWMTGGNYDVGKPVLWGGGGKVAIISTQWDGFPSPYPNNLQYGCWLQTVSAVSSITRRLVGVTVGNAYVVSFWHTCRGDNYYYCPPSNTFSVHLDGTIVYSTSPTHPPSSWVQVSTAAKVATSTSMMLMFQLNTTLYNSDYGVGINAISVQLVTPTGQPTEQPSEQPSNGPSSQPSSEPSSQPSSQPTMMASPPIYYVIPNMDCSGYDIGGYFTPDSRQSCNNLCGNHTSSGCVGTVWSEGPTCSTDARCGRCWLKTALLGCTADTGSTTTVQMQNSDSNYHVISNFDCWQNDIGDAIQPSTVSSCKISCTTNTYCVGFAFQPSSRKCWLKSGVYTSLNCGSDTSGGTTLVNFYVKKMYESIQGSENVMITTKFVYSGNYQTYIVPPVVKSLFVTAAGASAVNALRSTGPVYGGVIQAVIPVASINTLYLYLGGQNTGGGSNVVGGFNGGGTNQGGGGGGGGGATDIRTVIDDCTSRLLVAGGAGGSSGYGAGGAGGGLIGATGGGGGGSQTSGGADISNHNTGANTAGSFCHGGNGWYASGGGGYYGGAGDGGNGEADTYVGGGGGSSYCISNGTIVANEQGAHNGGGYLMIQQCVTEYEFVNNACVKFISPTSQPTNLPSKQPSTQPSTEPSSQPSVQPTSEPSIFVWHPKLQVCLVYCL